MTNTFKLAILISVAVHAAILMPYNLFYQSKKIEKSAILNLNYVVIQKPEVADKEESIAESSRDQGQAMSEKGSRFISVSMIDEGMKVEKEINKKGEVLREPVEEQMALSRVDQTAYLEYFNVIREKIRAQIHRGNSVGNRGEVTIVFTISPGGGLLSIDDVQTDISGLSDEVLLSIKKATPFPSFPEQFGREPITFSLTIKIA